MFKFLFGALGKIIVWVVKQLARLIALLAIQAYLHPRTALASGSAAAGVTWLGWQLSLTLLGGVFTSLSTWRAAHEASFDATVGTWTRTWWRTWWIYRRRWAHVFTRCGLVVQADTEICLPKLKSVTTTPFWDRLTVEMQIGQEFAEFQQRAEAIRGGFKGQRILVKEVGPLLLGLDFMRQDPLLVPVPATSIPASTDLIDWRRVPVGLDEFGAPFTVSLLGGHTCCSGSSGAGKAGLEWNVLRGVAPAIAAGLLRPVFIDPKGKELRQARGLVAAEDYAVTEGQVLALLERLVAEMNEANEQSGAAGERDFVPAKGRPLTLILIDEMAPLFKYWSRRNRDKIEDALGLLLTQGRAVGYIVFGAIQEPTKDVFTLRDLFTRKIALRLPTESHTDAALVEHAVDFGAKCHQILEATPGVLYSLEDGARSAVRARLGYVRDSDIEDLVAYVENARKVVNLGDWDRDLDGIEITAEDLGVSA